MSACSRLDKHSETDVGRLLSSWFRIRLNVRSRIVSFTHPVGAGCSRAVKSIPTGAGFLELSSQYFTLPHFPLRYFPLSEWTSIWHPWLPMPVMCPPSSHRRRLRGRSQSHKRQGLSNFPNPLYVVAEPLRQIPAARASGHSQRLVFSATRRTRSKVSYAASRLAVRKTSTVATRTFVNSARTP